MYAILLAVGLQIGIVHRSGNLRQPAFKPFPVSGIVSPVPADALIHACLLYTSVQFCAGAVGVQIQAVRFLMKARFLQGKPNGVAGTLALRMGSGDVVSVVGIAVAYDFRIDFRVSCLSVLIFLQKDVYKRQDEG